MEKIERKLKRFNVYNVKPQKTRIELEAEILALYAELSLEKRLELFTLFVSSTPTELLERMKYSGVAEAVRS